MIHRHSCVIAIVLLTLLLTGCWDRRELNDISIVVGMGIDKKDDQYLVSVQVVDPESVALKSGGGNRTPVSMYYSEGATISEAIRKMTTVAPRKVILAHVQMVIISEKVAKSGIAPALDFLSRNEELRSDFFVAIAKGYEAIEILSILTPLEKIPASKMRDSLKTSERYWAPWKSVTLDQLTREFVWDGVEITLTGITIKGDLERGREPKNVQEILSVAILQFSGMAIFKDDKLVGWLNEQESAGYNYIRDNVMGTVEKVPCKDEDSGFVDVELFRTKAHVDGHVLNGKPTIRIAIQAEGSIREIGCRNMDIKHSAVLKEIAAGIEEAVKNKIEKSIEVVQNKYKADVFGFGEVIRRSDPKSWSALKEGWDESFADVSADINVNIEVRRTGTTTNTLRWRGGY